MEYDIESYPEGQITAAIESADFDTAMALWAKRDWETYSSIRDALISVIRHRDSRGLELRHLQFIYFINKHLVPGCSRRMSDRQYFLKAA